MSFPPKRRLFLTLAGAAVVAALAFVVVQRVRARQQWADLRPPAVTQEHPTAPGLDARLRELQARLAVYPPDRGALREFTRVCHANGELDAAAAGYEALRVLEPAEPRWPYFLALIWSGYGRLDDAIPLLERTTHLAPDYLAGWLKLGDACLKENALAKATSAYEEVLRRSPGNAYALFGLARCDLQAGRLTLARSRLQQAVAAQAEDVVGAESLLAMVYDRLGNVEAAAAARARVQRSGHYTEPEDPWFADLSFESYDPYTLLTAGSAAAVEEKWDRAFALVERGLKLAPDDARLRRQLGKMLVQRGRDAEGRRELERAVALDPANESIRFDLLKLLTKQQDEAAIAANVKAGLAASPGSTGLNFEAGRLAARTGDLPTAVHHLELSWRMDPTQPAAALALADVYNRLGRYDDVVTLLQDVSQRFPQEAAATLQLARVGIEHGDARARRWIEEAATRNAPPGLVDELRRQCDQRFGAQP